MQDPTPSRNRGRPRSIGVAKRPRHAALTRALRADLAARLLTIGAAVAGNGFAAESATATDTIGTFAIDRFDVSGNTLLDRPTIDRLLGGFTGSAREFGDVERAIAALKNAYSARGYTVVQVVLPEQVLDQGVVRLQVIEARVGKVTVAGNRNVDEANVRRSLPELREGTIPNIGRISQSLRLANENPTKKTNLSLQSAERDGEVDVALQVADERPWALTALVANNGTPQTGRTNTSVQLQHFNLLGMDDVISGQYTTTAEHPGRVSVYGGGYHLPLYALGDSMDFFGSYSDVDAGTVAAGGLNLQVSGKGTVLGTRYNYNLERIGGYTSKIVSGIDYKAFRNSVDLQGVQLGNNATVRPFILGYVGENVSAVTNTLFSVTGSHNLPGAENGHAADLQQARSGASAHYTLVRYAALHVMPVPGGVMNDWQIRLALSGQWTRDALIPGEQFGAGGATTVRGFTERALANDRGFVGSVELQTPELCAGSLVSTAIADARCRLLAFYDSGHVSRNHALPGEETRASIASVGVGFRLAVAKRLSLQADVGRVVDGAANAAHKGDTRLHVAGSLSF